MSQISSLSYFEVSIRMDGEKVITHNCIDQWVIETACNRSGSQIQKIPTTFAFLLQNTVHLWNKRPFYSSVLNRDTSRSPSFGGGSPEKAEEQPQHKRERCVHLTL